MSPGPRRPANDNDEHRSLGSGTLRGRRSAK
jgi:hypothetical protein